VTLRDWECALLWVTRRRCAGCVRGCATGAQGLCIVGRRMIYSLEVFSGAPACGGFWVPGGLHLACGDVWVRSLRGGDCVRFVLLGMIPASLRIPGEGLCIFLPICMCVCVLFCSLAYTCVLRG
jgi:hypothetical protein